MKKTPTVPALVIMCATAAGYLIAPPTAAEQASSTKIVVWSDEYAAQREQLFLPTEPPFRSLGGAAEIDGKAVVFGGDANGTVDRTSSMVSLYYSLAIISTLRQADLPSAAPQCDGSGDSPDDPLHAVQPGEGHEATGPLLGCTLTRYTGRKWVSSQLITDDDRYLSVTLIADESGERAASFADVSDWIKSFLDELQ